MLCADCLEEFGDECGVCEGQITEVYNLFDNSDFKVVKQLFRGIP